MLPHRRKVFSAPGPAPEVPLCCGNDWSGSSQGALTAFAHAISYLLWPPFSSGTPKLMGEGKERLQVCRPLPHPRVRLETMKHGSHKCCPEGDFWQLLSLSSPAFLVLPRWFAMASSNILHICLSDSELLHLSLSLSSVYVMRLMRVYVWSSMLHCYPPCFLRQESFS